MTLSRQSVGMTQCLSIAGYKDILLTCGVIPVPGVLVNVLRTLGHLIVKHVDVVVIVRSEHLCRT